MARCGGSAPSSPWRRCGPSCGGGGCGGGGAGARGPSRCPGGDTGPLRAEGAARARCPAAPGRASSRAAEAGRHPHRRAAPGALTFSLAPGRAVWCCTMSQDTVRPYKPPTGQIARAAPAPPPGCAPQGPPGLRWRAPPSSSRCSTWPWAWPRSRTTARPPTSGTTARSGPATSTPGRPRGCRACGAAWTRCSATTGRCSTCCRCSPTGWWASASAGSRAPTRPTTCPRCWPAAPCSGRCSCWCSASAGCWRRRWPPSAWR